MEKAQGVERSAEEKEENGNRKDMEQMMEVEKIDHERETSRRQLQELDQNVITEEGEETRGFRKTGMGKWKRLTRQGKEVTATLGLEDKENRCSGSKKRDYVAMKEEEFL